MPALNWDALAVLVAFFALGISLYTRWQNTHDDIVRALQGEKEAVGYIALKMSRGELRARRRSRKRDYIRALFNAYLFESADRARALILAALRQADRRDIEVVWTSVVMQFNDYRAAVLVPRGKQQDIDRHYRRLDDLRRALALSVDERLLPAGTGVIYASAP